MKRDWRVIFLQFITACLFAGIFARLVYWHVFAGPELHKVARAQRSSQIEIPAPRGLILASDGFPLVTNQPSYLAYAYLPDLTVSPDEFAASIAPVLVAHSPAAATLSASEKIIEKDTVIQSIKTKITQDTTWVAIARGLTNEVREELLNFKYKALGFEEFQIRDYPEASMAAHLLGFVGSDGSGNPKGYFGLEGYYQGELAGIPGLVRQELDLSGKPIVTGDFTRVAAKSGRSVKTHIDRSLQLAVEQALAKGLERYQAIAGEVVVMDPHTGAVIALAVSPGYDPAHFRIYPADTYRNSAISESYEPGSTFKVLVMAAALDEGVVTPEMTCDETCNGPISIGSYRINTWNNQYHPGLTMTEVLKNSDNTGMVFVGRKLGKDALIKAIKDFGFGSYTGIDLEGEGVPPLRKDWKEIDLATGTFGQGIAVTSMQMVTAVSAIANGGMLFAPQVVHSVIEGDTVHEIKPKPLRRVLSLEATKAITSMMEESAAHGEAQWAAIKGYRVAGKTGTAQIPIAGHYDAEKTIASFIGFAPATNPKFVMLVKLREPQSSPWAAETAAPLWFGIAKDILRYYNITAE